MKNLQWHEPTGYRRAVLQRERSRQPWLRIQYATILFSGVMLFRAYEGWSNPNPNQPDWYVTTAVAAATAFFLVYLLPTVLEFLPNSLVILSEKGINNNIVGRGVNISFIPWDRIGKAVIDPVKLHGTVYRRISLYSPAGNHIASYGVGTKTKIHEIGEYFQSYSKEFQSEE